jgi:hypothetical protein
MSTIISRTYNEPLTEKYYIQKDLNKSERRNVDKESLCLIYMEMV